MDNELRNTCGAAALRRTMYQMVVALVHLWLWNLSSEYFEFTVLPSDIGMRSDVGPMVGKQAKVKLWLEPIE